MSNFVKTPSVLWRINEFSSVQKKLSPVIRFMGLKFHLNFSQFIASSATWLQLVLECQNATPELLSWQFLIDVYVLNDAGSRCLSGSENYNLKHNQWRIWCKPLSEYYKHAGHMSFIDFLVVITPTGNTFFSLESVGETKQLPRSAASLSEDIGKLFNNEENSDFTLKCDNRSFFVHKAILSARSKYFAAMFRSDMKENNEGNGKVENIEPNILELVLRYIYTGEIPDLSTDSVQKVYTAADRLLVEPLKVECYSLFIDNLSDESKEDSGKKSETQQLEHDKQTSETTEKSNEAKESQFLRNLFMTNEWTLFSEEFPDKAHEMCKPYLFHEL